MKPLVTVLSNRKDTYLPGCIQSLREHVTGWVDDYVNFLIVDDCADWGWMSSNDKHPAHIPVDQAGFLRGDPEPFGYTKAMRFLWDLVRRLDFDGPRDVFLVEEDFRFTRDVDLADLRAVLDADDTLAQVVLQRAPWYRNEKCAGSVIAAWADRVGSEQPIKTRTPTLDPIRYTPHDFGWSNNPTLIPASTFADFDWPNCKWSEEAMGQQVIAAGKRFAFYGWDGDAPHVEHVGILRGANSGGY